MAVLNYQKNMKKVIKCIAKNYDLVVYISLCYFSFSIYEG